MRDWVESGILAEATPRELRNGYIAREDAERLFPEALVSLDVSAAHIAEQDDVQFYATKQHRRLHARSSIGRAHWEPKVGVWIRYSCGVTSRPRREVCRPYCVAPAPLDPPTTTTTTTTTTTLARILHAEYGQSIVEMYAAGNSWTRWGK